MPKRYSENLQLGSWCIEQRKNKKQEILEADKINFLDKLGFVWDIPEFHWNKYIGELYYFYETNGHSDVPCKYPENPQLRTWCHHQREKKKAGKLSPDRIKMFDNMNTSYPY